jgi:hypothetical protein
LSGLATTVRSFTPLLRRSSRVANHDDQRCSRKTDCRLEKARLHLLAALNALRAGTLSTKEADAVEAIEDELIALRVGLLCGR